MAEPTLNRFAVIGNPVAHSLSPDIHQAFARQFGIRLSYEKILAEPDTFQQVVERFFADGGKGLNITTPFKSLAVECIDKCSLMAKASNSVNTIYKNDDGELVGETTDGRGWLTDIRRLKIQLQDKNILVIGAGGAARILINTLLEESIQSLHVCNRTVERAQQLVNSQKLSASGLDGIPETCWDLIVNTLSGGWHGQYPKIMATVTDTTYAYDLNYGEGAQSFRQWFLDNGGVQDKFNGGWGMLVEQAAESFNYWWNLRPVTDELIENGKSG